MEKEEKIMPSKRPRVEDLDDLRRVIIEKDKAYQELSHKFTVLMDKYGNLERNFNNLMEKFEAKFSSEETSASDNDMETEAPIQEDEAKKKAKKTKKRTKKKVKSAENAGKNADDGVNGKNADTMRNAAVTADNGAPSSSQGGNERKLKNVPIITTYNINIKEMTNVIDKALGHKNYNLKIMGKNVTNIGVCTLADFEKLKELLRNKGVNFYTYTPKGMKPFSVVVEGLSATYDVDDVKEYLGGLQFKLGIVHIVRLDRDRWLLQLSRDSDISAFYNVRYILRCRVTMRKFRKRGITQCFNCQRFGHASGNCHMPYRCVKCGESHGPGKCTIPPKGENTEETLVTDSVTGQAVRKVGLTVKCVNCGAEGHAASSKECPRRIELLRRIEAKKASRELVERPRPPAVSSIRCFCSRR